MPGAAPDHGAGLDPVAFLEKLGGVVAFESLN